MKEESPKRECVSGDGRRDGRFARFVGLGDHVANLAEQLLADHVVADFDRAGDALGVRPAMALDDDAVKARGRPRR